MRATDGRADSHQVDLPIFEVNREASSRLEAKLVVKSKLLEEVLLELIRDAGGPSKLERLQVTNTGDTSHIYVASELNGGNLIKRLADKVQRKDPVKCIYLAVRKGERLICMNNGFPLMVNGRRAVVVMKEFFDELSCYFTRYLGSGGAAMLWHFGKKWGEGFAANVGLNLAEASSPAEYINSLFEALKAMGWGLFTLEKADAECRSGIITVRDSCEATQSQPCHLIRGLLAGMLSEVLGFNVNLKETSHNDGGTCTFHFQVSI